MGASNGQVGGRRDRAIAFGRWIMAFLIVILWFDLAQGLGGQWLHWKVKTTNNPANAEGSGWWSGRLALPDRMWDTAYVAETGRSYNVFPPLQSIVAFVGTAPIWWTAKDDHLPAAIPFVVYGLSMPLVGLVVFGRAVRSPFWAGVLTLGWLAGTAVAPCLRLARTGQVYDINHVLSQIGLLVFAGEMIGRRRTRWMLVGLMIAAWSRQLTMLYGLGWLAVMWFGGRDREKEIPAAGRGRRMIPAVVGLSAILAVPMGLSWAKFGSPFKTGYRLIYEGRSDEFAHAAQTHGLFSTVFVRENAYWMNASLPEIAWVDGALVVKADSNGNSIWFTTPVLALIWVGAGAWWRDVPKRSLMLVSLGVIALLLCYHSTGKLQEGYYRFALDFIPVWFVVGATWLTTGWRRWATPVCVCWSVIYFGVLHG